MMTVTKVNVGGTKHALLNCVPRACGRVTVSQASPYFILLLLIINIIIYKYYMNTRIYSSKVIKCTLL